MALIAARDLPCRSNLVRIRQREPGAGVVECRIRPRNRVVALRTKRGWETRGNVIRHVSAERRRALPCSLMAAITIGVRRREGVIVIDVAVGAGIHLARRGQLVRTKQRPACRRVVERRRQK